MAWWTAIQWLNDLTSKPSQVSCRSVPGPPNQAPQQPTKYQRQKCGPCRDYWWNEWRSWSLLTDRLKWLAEYPVLKTSDFITEVTNKWLVLHVQTVSHCLEHMSHCGSSVVESSSQTSNNKWQHLTEPNEAHKGMPIPLPLPNTCQFHLLLIEGQ